MKLSQFILGNVTKTLLCFFFAANCSEFLPQVRTALQSDVLLQSGNEISKSLSAVIPLLQSFSSLCIVSGNEELLEVFINYNQIKNTIFTLYESGKTSIYNCECIVMLDVIPHKCGGIARNKLNSALYILHFFTPSNRTRLENCFQNSSIPEVVLMPLLNHSLFELSSIFPYPRFFSKSSFEEVISHRTSQTVESFGGVTITGAFMNYPPFTLNYNKPDELDGMEVLLLKELSQKLNFTLRYMFYDSWGQASPNRTWVSGVGLAMQEGLAQVAVCGLWQMYSFDPLVDFGPSMAMEEIIFLVRRPEQIDFDWKDVIKTFKPIVWYSVFVSFILVSVVYWYGVSRVLPLYREDWMYSVLTVFGYFTMSTSQTSVSDSFTRHVLTTWSVFSLLLTTALSTGIVSSLTLPQYSPRVDTVQQMVEQGYFWTAQFYREFQSIDLKQSMFDFKDDWHILFEKEYRYMTEDEVRAIAYTDEKVAFSSQVYDKEIVILDTYGTRKHEALGRFRVAREPINKGHVTFGVEKKSPLLEPLSKMTLRFIEAGLPKQWKSAVIRRWPEYDTRHLLVELDVPTFGQPEVMSISKLWPLFYLLLAGLTLAFVIFCFELLWYYS